jgi:hypothetical protein
MAWPVPTVSADIDGGNITNSTITGGTIAPTTLTMPAAQLGTDATEVPYASMLGSAAYAQAEQIPQNRFTEVKSSAYTVTMNDHGKVLIVSGTTTITLPPALDAWAMNQGWNITVKAKTGATVTVARQGSDTIDTVSGNLSVTANTAKTFVLETSTAWETL